MRSIICCFTILTLAATGLIRGAGAETLEPPKVEFQRAVDHDLPSLVIAYAFLASAYPNDLTGLFNALESSPAGKRLERLHFSLLSLKTSIPTRIGFPQHTFVVDSDAVGQQYGFSWAKRRPYGELFVTTPLRLSANRTLVVFSSDQPQHTTISTLDNDLKAELLYDSFSRNTLGTEDDPETPLATVYHLQVKSDGRFELHERRFHGVMGGGGGRVLMLDSSKPSIEIITD